MTATKQNMIDTIGRMNGEGLNIGYTYVNANEWVLHSVHLLDDPPVKKASSGSKMRTKIDPIRSTT